jgi:hypothetical protein
LCFTNRFIHHDTVSGRVMSSWHSSRDHNYSHTRCSGMDMLPLYSANTYLPMVSTDHSPGASVACGQCPLAWLCVFESERPVFKSQIFNLAPSCDLEQNISSLWASESSYTKGRSQ